MTADGWRYTNPHVDAYTQNIDNAWKDTLSRADAENVREGRGLTTKYYY
jgi:hypothetical protein